MNRLSQELLSAENTNYSPESIALIKAMLNAFEVSRSSRMRDLESMVYAPVTRPGYYPAREVGANYSTEPYMPWMDGGLYFGTATQPDYYRAEAQLGRLGRNEPSPQFFLDRGILPYSR